MTEQIATAKQPRGLERTVVLTIIVAIAAGGCAFYEYRQSMHLDQLLKTSTSELTRAQRQIANLRNELSDTAAKLNELEQRNFPVALSYRRVGSGLAALFKNNAPTPISFSVSFFNPVNSHHREANLQLPGNGVQSIGEAEGWVFAPGQHIQMTNDTFGSIDYTVPEQQP